MTKVLILGSKPGAVISEFDVAYCANTSSSFYAGELSVNRITNGEIVALVSASEFSSKSVRTNTKHKWQASRIEKFTDNSKSKVLVIRSQKYPEVKRAFETSQFLGEVNYLDEKFEENLCKLIVRNSYPIVTLKHFKKSIILTTLHRLSLDVWAKISGDSSREWSGLFRPSTGLLALLVAIQKHGQSAKYNIAGIGLADRGLYPDDNNNTWTSSKSLKYFHVIVDAWILQFLSKRYDITFQEGSLW